jgi:signal transduction histidine kinase
MPEPGRRDRGDAFLRTKVARRLLLLFVACALVPTLLLAGVTLERTSDQLDEQARTWLHQMSKSMAMSVHERLSIVQAEARAVVARAGSRGSAAPGVEAHLEERLRGLTILRPGRDPQVLLGARPLVPALSPEQQEGLASVGALVITLHDEAEPSAPARVLLMAEIEPGSPRAGHFVVELDPLQLMAAAGTHVDGSDSDFCLLDDSERVMACSLEGPPSLPADLAGRIRAASSGEFVWSPRSGDAHLARWWSLFLRNSYGTSRWTVVLGRPQAAVMAPIARFKETFLLVVLASLGVVAFLSIGQIRRSLVPLRKLQEGTRRIAERDFESRVQIESGDEFEDLADSFNAMAQHLDRQFGALAAMNEVDRAILSSMDPAEIVRTLLAHLRESYTCRCVLLLLPELEEGGNPDLERPAAGEPWIASLDAGERAVARCPLYLEPADRAEILASTKTASAARDGALAKRLAPLCGGEPRSLTVLPLVVHEELAGALVVVDAEVPDEDLVYVRQLADQAAVALANARMVEEIRGLNRDLERKVKERTAELTRALAQLQETQSQLVHREKMASVGQLVAGVAHEIKNPMNFIQGNLHLMREYTDTLTEGLRTYEAAILNAVPESQGRIDEIRAQLELDYVLGDLKPVFEACDEGCERSMAIIEDLLTFSRLDRADISKIDLRKALKSTMALVRGRLSDVELVEQYGDIPLVECMASQINQVFLNLVSNAADAVAGRPDARITVRTRPLSRERVRIEVEDTGCGIDPEHLPRIFEPFYTTKPVGEGTGLGLAVSYGVIDRHEGCIQVRTRVGEGTRFIVELPVSFRGRPADEGEEVI